MFRAFVGSIPTNLGPMVDAVVRWTDTPGASGAGFAGGLISHGPHTPDAVVERLRSIPVGAPLPWCLFADREVSATVEFVAAPFGLDATLTRKKKPTQPALTRSPAPAIAPPSPALSRVPPPALAAPAPTTPRAPAPPAVTPAAAARTAPAAIQQAPASDRSAAASSSATVAKPASEIAATADASVAEMHRAWVAAFVGIGATAAEAETLWIGRPAPAGWQEGRSAGEVASLSALIRDAVYLLAWRSSYRTWAENGERDNGTPYTWANWADFANTIASDIAYQASNVSAARANAGIWNALRYTVNQTTSDIKDMGKKAGDFIADPPIWLYVIGAILLFGAAGGRVNLLGGQ